jgi:DNA primase
VVEAYYNHRCLAVPKTENLRFVASLKHKSGASYPAIIARAEHVSGAMTGIQRTFLAHDGAGKAPVDKKLQKMSLGCVKGSLVRLADLIDGAPLFLERVSRRPPPPCRPPAFPVGSHWARRA